jgi:apolipoprotein N-acyltransferase
MSFAAFRAVGVPVCLGAVAGAAFGLPAGWLLAQAALIALLAFVTRRGCGAAEGACAVAAFASGMAIVGHAGFALGAPAEARLLVLLPLAAYVLVGAVGAGSLSYLALRAPVSTAARLAVVIPSLWTLRDWLASLGELALPWLHLGDLQAPEGPLAGALPLGGTLLAGWLMLSSSGLLVVAWRSAARVRCACLAAIAIMLLGCFTSARHEWTRPMESIDVALLQTGIASEEKHRESTTLRILDWHRLAIAANDAALLVSSQLAIPKTPAALPPGYLNGLQALLTQRRADALIGMYFDDGKQPGFYNGVLALGSSGVQYYLKSHLFPFGEFMPLPATIRRWVDRQMAQPRRDMLRAPDAESTLVAGGHRLAPGICFEAAFGDVWRRHAASADLLVNIASDSAIESAQLARQFRQIVIARALELHKPLLRTSDVRGTFIVEADGRILAELPPLLSGTLRAAVKPRAGLTPYGRFGDGLVLTLAALVLAASLLTAFRHAGAPAPGQARLSQAGVVLPAAVALMLVIGALFYLMVNAGQTVSEKIRITNAADAAAYSAGIVEARALNYDAYLNRAIVANEIAIAQMVSLGSWLKYFGTASSNYSGSSGDINFFMQPDPRVVYLDGVFGGINFVSRYFTGRSPEDYADWVINFGIGGSITMLDGAVQVLTASQQAVHVNLVAGIRQQQVANEVVQAMDTALRARVVLETHGFDAFTKTWSDDDRQRLKDVIMDSRDLFTRERNWTIRSPFDIPFVRNDGELKKRGGTELIGFDEWRGVDTLELHGQRWGCGRVIRTWCDDIRHPVGWGAVEVDAGGGDQGHGYHGNAYNENATTAEVADEIIVSPRFARFSGLPGVRELRDVDPRREPSTAISVRVWKSHADTLTSGNAAQARPSGQLALFDDRPAGAKLMALARAQIFFDRIAPRADGRTEIGSLYNPYWRVRLVAPTAADKADAALAQGGLALP